MKFLIVATLVVVATAAPQQPFSNKPFQADSFQAQPFQAKSFQADSFQADSFQAQPFQAKTFQADSFQTQPYEGKTFQAQPFQAETFQDQSFQAQPFPAQPYKRAVVATVTKTVTKPVTYQVPVATITKSAKPAAQPLEPFQYNAQPQYTGAKQLAQPFVQIIKLEKNLQPSGDYSYFFQADNGIQASEKAVIKAVRDEKNEEHYVPNVEGSYSYTGPDGVQYTVNYVADEFGYRASGAHLPVPPPIPEEIQRSLQFNAQ